MAHKILLAIFRTCFLIYLHCSLVRLDSNDFANKVIMAHFDLGYVSYIHAPSRNIPYQLIHSNSNHVLSDDNWPGSCQKQLVIMEV